ncbi:MAG: hypothetical protein ACTSRG_23110 [Candidatus Helarchaeota archaeon]
MKNSKDDYEGKINEFQEFWKKYRSIFKNQVFLNIIYPWEIYDEDSNRLIDDKLDYYIYNSIETYDNNLEVTFESDDSLGIESYRDESLYNVLNYLYEQNYLPIIECLAQNLISIKKLKELINWDIIIENEIILEFKTPLTESKYKKFENIGKEYSFSINQDIDFVGENTYFCFPGENANERINIVNFIIRANSISEIKDVSIYIKKEFYQSKSRIEKKIKLQEKIVNYFSKLPDPMIKSNKIIEKFKNIFRNYKISLMDRIKEANKFLLNLSDKLQFELFSDPSFLSEVLNYLLWNHYDRFFKDVLKDKLTQDHIDLLTEEYSLSSNLEKLEMKNLFTYCLFKYNKIIKNEFNSLKKHWKTQDPKTLEKKINFLLFHPKVKAHSIYIDQVNDNELTDLLKIIYDVRKTPLETVCLNAVNSFLNSYDAEINQTRTWFIIYVIGRLIHHHPKIYEIIKPTLSKLIKSNDQFQIWISTSILRYTYNEEHKEIGKELMIECTSEIFNSLLNFLDWDGVDDIIAIWGKLCIKSMKARRIAKECIKSLIKSGKELTKVQFEILKRIFIKLGHFDFNEDYQSFIYDLFLTGFEILEKDPNEITTINALTLIESTQIVANLNSVQKILIEKHLNSKNEIIKEFAEYILKKERNGTNFEYFQQRSKKFWERQSLLKSNEYKFSFWNYLNYKSKSHLLDCIDLINKYDPVSADASNIVISASKSLEIEFGKFYENFKNSVEFSKKDLEIDSQLKETRPFYNFIIGKKINLTLGEFIRIFQYLTGKNTLMKSPLLQKFFQFIKKQLGPNYSTFLNKELLIKICKILDLRNKAAHTGTITIEDAKYYFNTVSFILKNFYSHKSENFDSN